MTEQDKIEAVARALQARVYQGDVPISYSAGNVRQIYTALAEAAITAYEATPSRAASQPQHDGGGDA